MFRFKPSHLGASLLASAGLAAPDCPRTLDLVGRAVHLDVPPQLDDRDVEEYALALRKVALGVLA